MRNAPWNTDDRTILEVKWQVANERALECEKLKSKFGLIQRTQTKQTDLSAQFSLARGVADAASLAADGLFPTGLLRDDFDWLVHQHGSEQRDSLIQAKEAASHVPQCPNFLWKHQDHEAKAVISLIQSKRWKKLLPLFHQYATCIAELTRRFADALQESLTPRRENSIAALQAETNGQMPQSPDEWETIAKTPIMLLETEINVPPQQRLVLTRLLHTQNHWVTAGDIALVDSGWQDSENSATRISSVVSKLEASLGQQLGISFKTGHRNKELRPIQRRTASSGNGNEYRIDVKTLKELLRNQP